jgi:hypothetical protein
VAPAVITRDDKGGATMRAVRIDTPLKIDGQLDEEVSHRVWRRRFHHAGAARRRAGHEQTDTGVFFDSENLYIAARCWDDHPNDGL